MNSEQQPVLEIRDASSGVIRKNTIELERTATIGRQPTNEVVIAEREVSRKHAEIFKTPDGYYIRDLASTNGTYVNQERLTNAHYLLKNGDQIRLGASLRTLIFRDSSAAPAEIIPPEPEPEDSGMFQPTMVGQAISQIESPPNDAASEEAPIAEQEPDLGPPPTIGVTVMAVSGELDEFVAEPAEPVAKTGLPALVEKLTLRFQREPKPQEKREPTRPGEISPPRLSTIGKITLRARTLVEDFNLLRRRRTISVSVENGIIRVVVLQGQDIVAWGSSDPADGDPFADDPTGLIGDPDVSRIREVLTELRADKARVVSDLPLYTPLVRHLRLPQMKQKFFDQVVMQEVVESIPFGENEVDIKWRMTKDATGDKVMAIAVQQRIVDNHSGRMKETGVKPSATYSQAAALALVGGTPDAMVVHIGTDQAAVVLVRDWVPHLVHQVLTSAEGSSVGDQAEAIARAVEQMEGFNQTLAEQAGGRRLPIVLTGLIPAEGALEQELYELLDRDILAPAPQLNAPDEFPVAEYAVSAGLVILDQSRPKPLTKVSPQGVASLNLLSRRHLPAPLPIPAIGVFVALGLMAFSAWSFTPTVNDARQEAALASERLVEREEALREHRINSGAVKSTQNEIVAVRSQTLTIQSFLSSLENDLDELRAFFERIDVITDPKTTTKRVKLADLTPDDDGFVVRGSAVSFDDAFRYIEKLRNSELFSSVTFQDVDSPPGLLTLSESVANRDTPPQTSPGEDTSTGAANFPIRFVVVAADKRQVDLEPEESGSN